MKHKAIAIVGFIVGLAAIIFYSTTVLVPKQTSLAQWRQLRARKAGVGADICWKILVVRNFYNYEAEGLLGTLEGRESYPVICVIDSASRDGARVMRTMMVGLTLAEGDWAKVVGRYTGVNEDGSVVLVLDELENLGPR